MPALETIFTPPYCNDYNDCLEIERGPDDLCLKIAPDSSFTFFCLLFVPLLIIAGADFTATTEYDDTLDEPNVIIIENSLKFYVNSTT